MGIPMSYFVGEFEKFIDCKVRGKKEGSKKGRKEERK